MYPNAAFALTANTLKNVGANWQPEVFRAWRWPADVSQKLKTPAEPVDLPSTPELSMPASISVKTEVLFMSVLAARKPLLLLRLPVVLLLRLAERRLS